MALSGTGVVFGIAAAASGSTLLLGPLGIAILLSLAGYSFFKWAEKEESTPLDRWARRCFFGKHDEKPSIHWNKPEHAHIAIAELNAATLGVEASVSFKLKNYSSSVPQAGHSIASGGIPTAQLFLDYRLLLPHFDEDRSAYHWTLVVHRLVGGSLSNYADNEVITEHRLNIPTQNTEANTRPRALDASTNFGKAERQTNVSVPNTKISTAQLTDKNSMTTKEFTGAILLSGDNTQTDISAATLSLTYWPDRNIHEAFAELISMEIA
ncbi:hypothetical protein D9M71_497260 [compost metagenome]